MQLPCGPGGPCRPVFPLSPFLPGTPSRPSRPGSPSRPSLPWGPWTVCVQIVNELPLVVLSCVDCTLLASLSRTPAGWRKRWSTDQPSNVSKCYYLNEIVVLEMIILYRKCMQWHFKTLSIIHNYGRTYQQLYRGSRQQETPQIAWGSSLIIFLIKMIVIIWVSLIAFIVHHRIYDNSICLFAMSDSAIS